MASTSAEMTNLNKNSTQAMTSSQIPCKVASTNNDYIYLNGNPMQGDSGLATCSSSQAINRYMIAYKVTCISDSNKNPLQSPVNRATSLNLSQIASNIKRPTRLNNEKILVVLRRPPTQRSSIGATNSSFNVINSNQIPCKTASTSTGYTYLTCNPMQRISNRSIPSTFQRRIIVLKTEDQGPKIVEEETASTEETVSPEQLVSTEETLSDDEVPKQEENEAQNKMLNVVHSAYAKSGPVPYFDLVCDPDDYDKTVENMYQLSFLLANERILFCSNDPEADKLGETLKSAGTVLPMTEEMWKATIQEMNITKSMI